jgi:hypothetical protein
MRLLVSGQSRVFSRQRDDGPTHPFHRLSDAHHNSCVELTLPVGSAGQVYICNISKVFSTGADPRSLGLSVWVFFRLRRSFSWSSGACVVVSYIYLLFQGVLARQASQALS